MNKIASKISPLKFVSDAIFQHIQNNTIEVPLLPEVAGKVVRLTQDPEADAKKLANLIQSDQTLAGHVMKVANSAAYSPSSSMVSLQQAITRLGIKLISEIALSASINSSLFNTPGYEQHIQHCMKFSLTSGVWAKEIARLSRKNVESAFLSSLMHNIGRPVTLQIALKEMQEHQLELSTKDINKLEEHYHRAVAIKVVEEWAMPQSVIHVVRNFDNIERVKGDKDQTMMVVAGTKVASHFMPKSDHHTSLDLDELMNAPVFPHLNMYQDELKKLLEKHEDVQATIEAMQR